MSKFEISGNQPVQKPLQLDGYVHDQKSDVSTAASEIASGLNEGLSIVHFDEKTQLAQPAGKLYEFLAKVRVKFKSFFSPGDLGRGQNLPFPFKLSYQVQTQGAAKGTVASSIIHKVPRSLILARIADNRQGLVQLRSEGESGLGQTILDCLNLPEFDQGIPLTENQKILGCYAHKKSFCSTQWRLQVYDSAEKEMVEVPLTVIDLKDSKPNNLAEQMANIKVAMDLHLEDIHPAYQDSVQQPMVICDKQPRLANLVVAQEDMLSRLYSGQCHTFHDMDMQIEDVLHMVSPDHPLLESREEKLGFYSNLLEAFENDREHRFVGESMSAAHQIRASKRHMPVPDFPINPMPAGVVDRQLHPKPKVLEPGQAITPYVAADVSPPTLEGKGPLTRPSKLPANDIKAYREPLKQAQCSVNAINTFFQNEIVTSEKMASLIIKGLKEFSTELSGNTGLGRPEILDAIEQGKSITIKKSDFLAPAPPDKESYENLFNHTSPAEQWQDLINVIEPLGPRKNWVVNKNELDAIEELTITPSAWLSAYAEVGLDMVTKVVKETLETLGDNPAWSHMPEDVDFTNLDTKAKTAQLANDIQANIPIYMNLGKELSLIVLVGSGQNSGNHFYTISYNKKSDSWINLDSDQTEKADVQPCKEFCKNSELTSTLLKVGVQAAVVPTLY